MFYGRVYDIIRFTGYDIEATLDMRTFVKWQFHREIINDCIQTHGHGLYFVGTLL
jgi:hypothetical protein